MYFSVHNLSLQYWQNASFNTFEKPLSLVAPQDLKEIPTLQLEFQGKLSDYYNNAAINEAKPSFFSQLFSMEIWVGSLINRH